MFCISKLKSNDILENEKLLDEAFGEGRQKKTAYRLRDDIPAIEELSFGVKIDGALKASLQFWPIIIRGEESSWDALLLGPIVVCQDYQGKGIGLALMEHGLKKAKELGHTRVILVGDEPYYKRVGFSRDLARELHMPGPVEIERLLAHELVPGSMKDVAGLICRAK